MPGNDAVLLHDGPNTYQAMFDAIEKARDHVNLEFYIIEDDATGKRLAELLIRKRAEGVAVHDLNNSKRITLEEWERRPVNLRVMEWVARIWEYWL